LPVFDLPTGIVTFLFTDIEGRTRFWERSPEQAARCGPSHARWWDLPYRPTAIKNMTASPSACGEKKLVTSSSKNVNPVAPSSSA
jgi:hypothetical protein